MQPQILRIFLVLGTLFGAGYTLILPPLQAPDEFAHFYRAYGITEGTCVAPALTSIPSGIKEMEASFRPNMEEKRRIDPSYILVFVQKPLSPAPPEGVTNEAANMYSCFPYAPSALGIAIGRIAGASPVVLLYLSRLANLLAYLAIVYFALRQLPGFRLPVLALALMPMALSQAASASWDGVVYATACFLFAYILRLAWDPHIPLLHRRHYVTLGAAIVGASLCKTDIWLAPLLVLVPAPRFGGIRRKWIAVLGMIGLGLLVIAGWNYWNRDDMAQWVEHIKIRQIYLPENMAFLVHHPFVFVQVVMRTWVVHGYDFAAQFVGRLGWLAVTLPSWTIWMYFLLLVMTALADSPEVRMTLSSRLLCVAIGSIAMASVFVGMWCAETTRSHAASVLQGSGLVAGAQGRYFIPFALPFLLAISNRLWRFPQVWLVAIAAVTILSVNAVALKEVRNTYFVNSSAGPYEDKLVRRAGNAPDDTKVYLIRGGKRHWIIFGSWIEKHGYPPDLLILPRETVDAIPEGKLIDEQ